MFENEMMGENVEEVAQPQETGTDFEMQDDSVGDSEVSLPQSAEPTGLGSRLGRLKTFAAGKHRPSSEGANAFVEERGKQVQSAEENSKYAAARREGEARARAAESRMLGLAQRHGFNSVEELERHLDSSKQEEISKRFFETFGVDAADAAPVINDLVSNHPDVLAARQLAAQSREENAKLYIEREIAEIKKLDPGINVFDDLRALDNFPEIERLLMNNYSLSDAYKLVNFDAISKKGAEAAAQRVRNDAESKSHLKPHGGSGGDAIVVPDDVKEQYRFFNKGITDEEIARDYAKSVKRK